MTSQAAAGSRSYPGLRGRPPLLLRGPAELQVGIDQDPAVVLVGVHPQLRQVLALLDGRHSIADIRLAAVRLGVGEDQLDWCLRRLDEAGLLDDSHHHSNGRPGAASVERRTHRVRLIGAGRLGHGVATQLRGCIAELYVADDQPPDPTLYATWRGAASQAEALAAEADDSNGTRVRVLNHWSKPDGRPPDLTIVASDLIESDRVVADGLLRADQPHLFVRAGGGGVVVGPFVVPGQTACLHCTDLARRDADPAWPILVPQLSRITGPLSATQAGWAGSVAAAQALAFLHGAAPETYGATIELSAADHLTRWRSWSMHADCGCGWGSPAEWAE